MSIPEAPFNSEAHARKEGAWVVAYGKTALDAFVELCRSFYDGCRHYHAETKKIYDATVELLSTYLKDASADGKLYGRKDKQWTVIPTGGAGSLKVEVLRAMEWNTLDAASDTVMFLPENDDDTELSHVTVELPTLTETKAINFLIGPSWSHDSKGKLYVEIRLQVNSETGGIIYYSGGNSEEVQLGFKMHYILLHDNGSWYVTDALPAEPR